MTTVDTTDNAALWQEAQNWTDYFSLPLRAGALRRERLSRGLTLKAFHERSGVSRHHLSRIENRHDATVYVATARDLVLGLAGSIHWEEEPPADECGRLLRTICVVEEDVQ